MDHLHTPRGNIAWFPSVPAFVFGTAALAGAVGDMRVLAFGTLEGNRRIARHLWRMCLAMFIATLSFFLGQSQAIPAPLRIFPLLAAPVLLVLVLLVYWFVRVRFTRWRPARHAPPLEQEEGRGQHQHAQ